MTKTCPKCEAELPVETGFYVDRAKSDGRASWCKTCTRRRAREWGRQNPDRRAEISAAWVKHNRIRHTYNRSRGFCDTAREYVAILVHDPCSYCGAPQEQVDHIVPAIDGGPSEWDNLTAACRSCNASKRETPMLLWLAEIGPPAMSNYPG